MLVAVFVGFAHTYYLAALFRAPLPSRIILIHGALFSCYLEAHALLDPWTQEKNVSLKARF